MCMLPPLRKLLSYPESSIRLLAKQTPVIPWRARVLCPRIPPSESRGRPQASCPDAHSGRLDGSHHAFVLQRNSAATCHQTRFVCLAGRRGRDPPADGTAVAVVAMRRYVLRRGSRPAFVIARGSEAGTACSRVCPTGVSRERSWRDPNRLRLTRCSERLIR